MSCPSSRFTFSLSPISYPAALALHAAQNRQRWGRYATSRFATKQAIPAPLLRLALQLEAAARAGIANND